MSTNNTESKAVSYLKFLLSKNKYLDPYIFEKDKFPSIDGMITFYGDENHPKGMNNGFVFIQVKGHEKSSNISKKKRTKLVVDVDDLRNFLKYNGVVIFSIFLDDNFDNIDPYYNDLTPYKLRKILDNAKESQKTITIDMKSMPKDPNDLLNIIDNSIVQFERQSSFVKDKRVELKDFSELNDTSNLKGQFVISSAGKQSPDEALPNAEIYLMCPNKDDVKMIIKMPKVDILYKKVQEKVDVEGVSLYDSYKKILDNKTGDEQILIGDSILLTNLNGNKTKATYFNSQKVRSVYRDLSAFIAIKNSRSITLGNKTCRNLEVEPTGYEPSDENALAAAKLICDLLDKLKCKKDLMIDKVTDEQWKMIRDLYKLIVLNYSLRINDDGIFLQNIKIGNLEFKLVFVKDINNPGYYKCFDFFDEDLNQEISKNTQIDPFARFLLLTKYELTTLNDINYRIIEESVKKINYNSDELLEKLNYCLLFSLSAYDETKKDDILTMALNISTWMYEMNFQCSFNLEMSINHFQAIKRFRKFTQEEKDLILKILDGTDNHLIKAACSALMDYQDQAYIYLEDLEPKVIQEFLDLPIGHFIDDDHIHLLKKLL